MKWFQAAGRKIVGVEQEVGPSDGLRGQKSPELVVHRATSTVSHGRRYPNHVNAATNLPPLIAAVGTKTTIRGKVYLPPLTFGSGACKPQTEVAVGSAQFVLEGSI
jgi:hypothetical protein